MSKLFNLARVNTATTGTGTMTLGAAVSGFLTFAAAGAVDGDVVSYAVRDGASSEIGTGTYNSAGPTLTRTNILGSTNSNLAISLSGNAQVFITPNTVDFSTLAPLVAPSLTGPVLVNVATPQAQVVVGGRLTNNDLRYRKLIKLVAAPGQFRMTDQPPAEYIDGDLMIARGNIVFPSIGPRIIFDGSTTTVANRLAFQSSVVNGNTTFHVLPNGSATAVSVALETDSALTNGNTFTILQSGTESRFQSNIRGTGTQGFMTFVIGAAEKWRIDASGNLINTGLNNFIDFGAINVGTRIKLWSGGTTNDYGIGINANEQSYFTGTGAIHNFRVGGSSGTSAVTISGSGLTVSVGAFLNSPAAGTPVNELVNLAAGTDAKVWRNYALGNVQAWDITNDAVSAVGGVIMQATRSGNLLTKIEIGPSATPVEVNGILKATHASTAFGGLQVWSGDSPGTPTAAQIGFGWAGTFQYQHWIATRHDSATIANNQIRFYTTDMTAAGVFPTNAVLGLTISSIGIAVGALGNTAVPQTQVDVIGGIASHGGNSGSYYASTAAPAISMFYDVANDTGNIYSLQNGVAWKALHLLCNTFLVQAASAPVNAIFVDAAGNVAIGTTTTVSGSTVFNSSITCAVSINLTAVNAGIEIGSQSSSNTPFIDFHSSGGVEDYSSRIIATGGTSGTIGAGSLNINAKVFNVCADTATTAGGAAGHLLQFGTTAGFGIYFGSGAPSISAAKGSLYLRSDGITGASFYINNNGSTGWSAEG